MSKTQAKNIQEDNKSLQKKRQPPKMKVIFIFICVVVYEALSHTGHNTDSDT